MPNFTDLVNELNDDIIPEVDPSALPEQKAGRRDPLYPGTYEFTLPASFAGEVKDDGTRQLLQVNFRDAFALTANPGGKQWQGQLSNRPYEMTVWEGGAKKKVTVNDLALLLKALGYMIPLSTNAAYVNALNQYGGGQFLADSDWSARCDPKRAIWVDGQKVDGKMGCGARYGTRSYKRGDGEEVVLLPKDENSAWAPEFTCSCGAHLMVNDNLSRIRAKK